MLVYTSSESKALLIKQLHDLGMWQNVFFSFPLIKKKKILYEIIIICSFLVSPLECAQD